MISHYLHSIPKTKIVCTLGPASDSEETIEKLINAGLSIARLNMSHGDINTHTQVIQRVRSVAKRLKRPVGVMVDVPGAKYRTGPLQQEIATIEYGKVIRLTSEKIKGSAERVTVTPPGIHVDAVIGTNVLIDDGNIELIVTDINNSDVICKVLRGTTLTEKRGVVMPGRTMSQKFPDSVAKECLRFAAEYQADFVALSNITRREEIWIARSILREYGMKQPFIISKIEKAEAIDNLDEVIEVSDGLMVARGDMGVEVSLSQVPIIQKDLIKRSNAAGKPVITATQMLESMITSSSPTRAEVTDVANAVFDGTDAIMLSAETSVGAYPFEAVTIMAETAKIAETALPYENMMNERYLNIEQKIDDSISFAACQIANKLQSDLIVAFTESGKSAGRVSRYRPRAKILALTRSEAIERKLTLSWGVFPLITEDLENIDHFFEMGEFQARNVLNDRIVTTVILVAGTPIGVPGSTNMLKVLQLN